MEKETAPDREAPPDEKTKGVAEDVIDGVPAAEPDVPGADPARVEDASPPAAASSPVTVRRGGIVAPLVGGALAAALGFGLSHFDAFGLRPATDPAVSEALDRQAAEIAGLKTALGQTEATLAERIARVEPLLAAEPPAPADLGPLTDRLATLEDRLTEIEALPATGDASSPALQAAIRALEARVASLSASAEVPDELSQKVDTALQRLSDAEAAAAEQAEAATATVEAARRAAAVDRLAAAVDRGEPFQTLLSDLALDPVPPILAENAATGVQTLADLTEAFPDAARSALLQARDVTGSEGWGTRLAEFLKAQTGARPLSPQEGTEPEAVLSRAEAALRDGRVADAVAELQGLPPEAAAAMADWVAAAQARADVDAAVAALRASTEAQGE